MPLMVLLMLLYLVKCFEHNPFYKETIQNVYRMLKPGGMFLFTCATTGRPVHGVASLEEESKKKFPNWKTMPNVIKENWDNNYYKNLTEEDIRECIDIDNSFSKYEFEVETNHCDLFFYGFKK
jgi:SAM-dependent methyltransferase